MMPRLAPPPVAWDDLPSGAARAALDAEARALAETLSELQPALRRLIELSERKLAALRRADTEGLTRCAQEEKELLQSVQLLERRRHAVLARLAQQLRWPPAAGATLSHIADRLHEPISSVIRARIAPLRDLASTLEKTNRLAASVARNLHQHLRALFADVARANQETVVYGPLGQPEMRTTRAWVDAVG
jgi:hypothetical protein